MIVILNDNTICDNTNLNNPINKKGLVLPSLFKVRNQLYNKTEINDEPKCNGEECMKDTLFAFFLDGSENTNNNTNSKINAKIHIIKTKKKENKKANKATKKQTNKTKKNKQKSTKK